MSSEDVSRQGDLSLLSVGKLPGGVRGGDEFWELGGCCCPFSASQEGSSLGLFSSVGGILPAITLALTGVWSRDESSEVEAQSIWGVVVGVIASQLSSLGSGTSWCYRGIFKQLALEPPSAQPLVNLVEKQ